MDHAEHLLHDALHWVVLGINAVTAIVLVWSVAYGVARFTSTEFKRISGADCDRERAMLRRQVGFYLLFALELLIAADIIETMLSPTYEHLAVLGGVSAIRIVIGFALSKELAELSHDTPTE